MTGRPRLCALMLTAATILAPAGGCEQFRSGPKHATRAYPSELHSTNTVDIQVFRDNTEIQLVNATARSYRDFDLWLNQRYMRHVEALPAGESIRMNLWDFFDQYGQVFNAGGFFRRYEPTPLRLTQIQPGPEEEMVGLVTIRAEDVVLRRR